MDEATRQLFTARFEELMTKIQSLESNSSEREAATKQLQEELEQAKSAAAQFQEKTESSDTMQRILEGQVSRLMHFTITRYCSLTIVHVGTFYLFSIVDCHWQL